MERETGMKSTWLVTAALAATFAAPPRAGAQRATVPEPTPHASMYREASAPPVLAERGPMLQTATISPRLAVAERVGGGGDVASAAPKRPFGTSQTLMIVGGAALVAGAIIGDDAGTVFMVAGAGVGLYGLYLYLRQPAGADSRAVGVGYSIPVSP